MLPKKERLKAGEFSTYSRANVKKKSPHLFLEYTHNKTFKASVVVSKKVSKKAVNRNRIRRVLYSILAQNQPMLPTGVYIVRVKANASDTSVLYLKKELRRLLGQIEMSR